MSSKNIVISASFLRGEGEGVAEIGIYSPTLTLTLTLKESKDLKELY
jgi:hypothetical protein